MYVSQRADGKWQWQIKVGDDVVASDASQGYENKQDALHSLFLIFFGDWNETFLTLYADWQAYAGEAGSLPEGAEDGPPVRVNTSLPPVNDADGPNYESAPTEQPVTNAELPE
jgi:uncharacterized protein YegP (UPF0339 family)